MARYRDQIREIMRLAIESGRGIEINTWKGRTLREWIPMLKDYKELGGEIITVGSDAHAPEPLGLGVKEAYGLMQDCRLPLRGSLPRAQAGDVPVVTNSKGGVDHDRTGF